MSFWCFVLCSGWPRFGSVRLRFGDGTVRAVPVFGSGGSSAKRGFSVFQHSFTGKDGSGSGFGSWKTVPAVPVPRSVPAKTVPTVPVSGSGSVPGPPCLLYHSVMFTTLEANLYDQANCGLVGFSVVL